MAWRFPSFARASAALIEILGGTKVVSAPSAPLGVAVAANAPTSDATNDTTSDTLVARFWGVRGSYPTPRLGAGAVGGETTCLEVRYGRQSLIIDAGSGIIALGEDLARRARSAPGQRQEVTVLLTHAHHDHLCGLPFFAPLYDARFHVRFFGPDLGNMRFEDIIAGYMRAPYFPVDFRSLPAQRSLRSLRDGERLTLPQEGEPSIGVPGARAAEAPQGALLVDALFTQQHPADGAMLYRISGGAARLVFATDVEIGPPGARGEQRLAEFARGADTLVHDAQYSDDDYHGANPKHGFGHSTPTMAARVAREAGVGRLVLFHHDPHYSDAAVMELQRHARRGFPEVVSAREGMELRLDGARRRLV